MKKLLYVLSFVLAVAFASDGQTTNQLHFSKSGFTIAPLDEPPGQSPQQVLMMFLPATKSFAPNVNVQIQPYAGTIEDYVTLSLEQFKSMGLKLSSQKAVGKSAVTLEYTGEMKGKPLHWYARAEKSGDKIYVATATASEEQWGTVATQLKTCVDSFRCENGE
ncbi:MAG TPA: hypothetical protein VGR14_12675 [Verrucomicrobiae bacterium]|jgi:hypothetical protein|nr:hypothetical protein [Verrucomicrobiae bacterium]